LDEEQRRSLRELLLDGSRAEAEADRAPADARTSSAASVSRLATKHLFAGRRRKFVIVVGERADRIGGVREQPPAHAGMSAATL